MELFSDLPRRGVCDVQRFTANSATANVGWHTWRKRPGVSMVQIFCLAGGGGGGNGVVGANSTAAGGGGGGSSGQTVVTIPAIMVPDWLFVSVGYGGGSNASGIGSRVSATPDTNSSSCLAIANPGAAGGNGSGGTGGGGGAAGGVVSANAMYLGWPFSNVLAGQGGSNGGAAVEGITVTMPATGLFCMGGCGGGGLPAAGVAGKDGGFYQGTSAWGQPPRGLGGTSATTPGGQGSNGAQVLPGIFWHFGGTGGGSSHGSATGAGLAGGPGGAGGYGCGGGGGGGALTGSTQGLGGKGGDGIVIITAW